MSQVTIGKWKFTGWKANVIGLFFLVGWHLLFVTMGFGVGYVYARSQCVEQLMMLR